MAKQLDHPFEHEQKLTVAAKRQQEIVNALDITKNQASAAVTESAEENGEAIEEKPGHVTNQKAGRKKGRRVTV